MQQKLHRCFNDLAAALLIGLAAALLLANFASSTLIQPRDPILMLSTRTLFWILGAGGLALALVCSYARNPRLKTALVLWFALNWLVYGFGIHWQGRHGIHGYLGSLADTFGFSTTTAESVLLVIFTYLFVGSSILLLWSWKAKPIVKPSEAISKTNSESDLLKMTCVLCKGHIQFSAKNLEQKIPCPHCHGTITLKRQENIKSACASCDGHLEFPIDALGQTIACPHCQTSITLQRQ